MNNRRRSSRERKKEKKDLQGRLIIAACIMLVAGVGFYALWLIANKPDLDMQMCPKAGPSGYTAVLVDTTDYFNEIQKMSVMEHLMKLKSETPQHARMSVYAISNELETEPEISICNPGDASGVNPFTENPEKQLRRWETEFSERLDRLLAELLQPSVHKKSPIMEMIQAVSVSAFPMAAANTPKRLIIVSDMLHNTNEYSQYTMPIDLKWLQAKPYYQKVRTDLRDVEVKILYLRRDGAEKFQMAEHILFWASYMKAMRSKHVSIERIPG